MKIRPLSRREVRRIDEVAISQYAMTGLMLMENAGAGAAAAINQIVPQGRIVVLCGKGNNGGDGYVIARHLDIAGRDVSIVSLAELSELTGDAQVNSTIARHASLPIRVVTQGGELTNLFDECACVVDCLLGTGARGVIRSPMSDAIELANQSNALRVAIDLPTGIDCDNGSRSGVAFRADATVTFVAKKTGMLTSEGAPYCGEIHEVGIGVPRKLLDTLGFTEE